MQTLANNLVMLRAFDGDYVPSEVALKLIQTFRIEDGWADYKTRAVWFSTADLHKILTLIDGVEGDGVRIYFGRYPRNIDLPGTPDVKYKNESRDTLVFVPTTKEEDGSHKNYFSVVGLTDPSSPIILTGKEDGNHIAYDHGELEP